MGNFFLDLFDAKDFMPHAVCYLWETGLIRLHAFSDSLIALSYFSISLALIYFAAKRKDLEYKWVFILFGFFILSCGGTHVLEVGAIWKPMFWLAGYVKAATALISFAAAILIWPLIPKLLSLPSPAQLASVNKKLEETVAERERNIAEMELYRLMIEKTADPVFLIDIEDGFRMAYVNEAAVRHYGAPKEEILTWRIPDWDPNFKVENLPEHLDQMRSNPGMVIETLHRTKSGKLVPVQVSLNLTTYKGRQCHFGYFKDISERKKAEQEIISAKERAEKSDEAKSRFLASMSHELRTPMNAILGFGQLLESDSIEPLTENQRESVEQILKSGNHLLELITEVLDLSKIESGRLSLSLEEIELAPVLKEVLVIVDHLARKRGIKITMETGNAGQFIRADRTRLKQVFMNLFTNAVKYNRPGGSVRIWPEDIGPEKVRVCVEDTGPGIAPEKLEFLYEPFNRLGAETLEVEGTGIGLTIAKKLVELMGGGIGVESRVGKGSKFYVDIKKTETPKELSSKMSPERDRSDKVLEEKKKILCVEDNPANLKLVESILKRRPHIEMLSAPQAEIGLELARAHRPDLILLDINLPGMSGFDALARLREFEETKDIPVLAVSANAMPRDIEKGKALGFRDYITKPINVGKFLEAVDGILDSGGDNQGTEKK